MGKWEGRGEAILEGSVEGWFGFLESRSLWPVGIRMWWSDFRGLECEAIVALDL